LLATASQIIEGGADIIQIRAKELSTKELIEKAEPVRELARQHDVLFIVNDRPDVAVALDADGVHLGQEDMPINLARQTLGIDRIIGVSTHNIEQAKQAEAEGADYIDAGPVFFTPAKKDTPPTGVGFVESVKKSIRLPFVAIGGINKDNIAQLSNIGVKRIAVIRAILEAEDVTQATRQLKAKICQ